MKALIAIHHPQEGPGLLKDILGERGWEAEEVWLWQRRGLPEAAPFHLLILMGGPMSVNREDLYPFLSDEKDFVRGWIREGNPILGICLGAQLIADVLGGRVYKGRREEIGWYKVTLTEEGKCDPHLRPFPPNLPVFQWHGETFDLPEGAVLLATSEDYPHQAFRFGNLTYAFQFHLEPTENMIRTWLAAGEVDHAKTRVISASLHCQLPAINQLCRSFMQHFLESIELQASRSA